MAVPLSGQLPGASSHSPVAIASNASVRTERSPSARALTYKVGRRASAPGAHAATNASPRVGDDAQGLLAPAALAGLIGTAYPEQIQALTFAATIGMGTMVFLKM